MNPRVAVNQAAKAAFLMWVFLGAATYYVRFTRHFLAEHGDAIRALWSQWF